MLKHKVTLEPVGITVEVDPELYPFGRCGEGGSILDIALGHGVHIEHACGGVGACATCHVIVTEGMENLSEPDDAELDTVERAPDGTPASRLACRAAVHGHVTVNIPGWNCNIDTEKP